MANTTAEIVESVKKALGDVLEKIEETPFDPSHSDLAKIQVRIQRNGWGRGEAFIDTNDPVTGRENLAVIIYGSWQYWRYDTIRDEARKIIRALQLQDWNFESVAYEEDGDTLAAAISFDRLQLGNY